MVLFNCDSNPVRSKATLVMIIMVDYNVKITWSDFT